MPPKTRKRRGKDLVAAVAKGPSADESAAANEQISPDYVEAVIGELELESERRVKKLKRAMGDMRQEFQNHFQVRRRATARSRDRATARPPSRPPPFRRPRPDPASRWSCSKSLGRSAR